MPKEKDGVEGSAPAEGRGRMVPELFEWVETAVQTLVCVMLIFTFVARTSIVFGTSMIDTLHHNDLLVVSRLLYVPQRGDIVVVTKPNYENEPIVKRIIALEGQRVDIDFELGVVTVDGVALDESYVHTPTNLRYDVEFPVVVPEGELFVLGDNRNGSLDSRSTSIGFIDERYVMGKAYWRVLPFSAFGALTGQ